MQPEFLAFSDNPGALIKPSVAEVAFLGRSNVGKSSLINTLVKQKIARTSTTPGRTQGLVFFKVRNNLIFVDFPGFGYARTSKTLREQWAGLADGFYSTRRTLKGAVWIYDIRRDPDPLDHQMLEWLQHHKKPFCLILNKCDYLNRGKWTARKKEIMSEMGLDDENVLVFSSKTREGAGALWKWLDAKC